MNGEPSESPLAAPNRSSNLNAVELFLNELRKLDGHLFEHFVRDVIAQSGYTIVQGPAVGPDGGKDLLVRVRYSEPGEFEEIWVVQCKWSSKPDFIVSDREIVGFQSVCTRHAACGYLLVTNGQLAERLKTELSAHRGNGQNHSLIKATAWDGTSLCNRLMRLELAVARKLWLPQWDSIVCPDHKIKVAAEGIDLAMAALGRGDQSAAQQSLAQLRQRLVEGDHNA